MEAALAAAAATATVLLSGSGGPPRTSVGRGPGGEETRAAAAVRAPAGRWTAAVVGVTAALVILLLAPGWTALAAPVVGLVVWRRAGRLEPTAVRRRREELERELPHLVDLVRALVDAGASPDRALASAADVIGGATASELRPWTRRLQLGSDPAEVWHDLSRHAQLGRLGLTLHRAAVSGAAVGGALQRLADDLRAALRADVQRRVRQVEVRATAPLGACLLPAFVVLGVVPLVAGAARGLVAG